MPEIDAEFTTSSFGGGWLLPLTDAGRELATRVLGEDASGDPPWPDGWIVEPWQMCTLCEWSQFMGVAVEVLD